MLLFRFVTFIVHALIFFLRFSQKQKCKPAKKYRGMFYYIIEKHMQKFGHFWRKKHFTRKKSLTFILHNVSFIKLYNIKNFQKKGSGVLTIYLFIFFFQKISWKSFKKGEWGIIMPISVLNYCMLLHMCCWYTIFVHDKDWCK